MPGRQPLRSLLTVRLPQGGFTAAPVAAAVLLALGGCGGDDPAPAAVAVPTPAAQAAALCAQVVAQLPGKVDDAARRPTAPASTLTAAWGEPTVVLRCGVPRPPGLSATSHLETINGVDWLLLERPGERVFTAVGRAAYVELTVPAGHEPQVGPLVDVAAAVSSLPVRAEQYSREVPAPDPTPDAGHGADH